MVEREGEVDPELVVEGGGRVEAPDDVIDVRDRGRNEEREDKR